MEKQEGFQDDLGLSEEQMRRLEQNYREKQMQRNQHKKSMEKRGSSIKLKNISRESTNFNREEMDTVQCLANYLENVDQNIELIDQFCQKKRIHFLNQLRNKISCEEYKAFLGTLQLYKLPQGNRLQQEGKNHCYHYILVEGRVAAFRERKVKEEQKEYLQCFQYQNGQILISNTLQTHKSNPYTVKAKKLSLLLRFTDDTFLRYLKKIYQKEFDQLASILSHTLIFKGISSLQLKKFLPYCFFRRYRYNELVYEEGDLIRQLFLILQGEAEISYEREDKSTHKQSKGTLAPLITPNLYKMNHEQRQKKEYKIVKTGRKELFGLENAEVYKQNYYEHHVRVTSDRIKVLVINLDVLYDIQMENPSLQDNLHLYLKKITNMHMRLLEKYQNVATVAPLKKKKKKRKMRRKQEISLEWWGLAQKIEGSKKYRLPTPPKSKSQQNLTRKQPLLLQQRTSKLDYFKRRLFQDQIQALQQIQQKQNLQQIYPPGLIPKLQKMKIKMINAKPKVINNAQRIKKKLMDYAKNGQIFCDKLQLQ